MPFPLTREVLASQNGVLHRPGIITDSPTRGLEDAESRLFDRYGLDVRSRFLDLRDPPMRVHVLEVGTGSPVLMVHGGGGGGAAWAPLMAPLIAGLRGVRLVAVDRPGCGQSEALDYRGVDLRRHAVAFLESVMDELMLDRAAVVANSMGGLWSFWLAIDRPDRVSALAQLGCPALLLKSTAPLSMRLLSVRSLGHVLPSAAGQSSFADLAVNSAARRLPVEMLEYLRRAERRWARGSTRLSLVRRTLRLRGARPGMRLGPRELAAVSQPTLFLWGDRDRYGRPDVGRRATEIMPDATMQVLAAGHMPWLEEPGGCADAIQAFLRGHVAPPLARVPESSVT
jgi:2-hydroxy-6-oxonona-2,4-dienedioate hydrolase